MFKERLKEASAWILAAAIMLVIILIPVGLVALTGLINKNLPIIITNVLIIGFWACYLIYVIWKWIKWQFIEPYQAAKAAKAEKEAKGE